MGKVLVISASNDMSGNKLREIRDYAIESIRLGILVLPVKTSWCIEDFPELGNVVVNTLDDVMQLAEPLVEQTEVPPPQPVSPPVILVGPGAREKRMILERLMEYRKQNGLGCFQGIADIVGSPLTDAQIRSVSLGEKQPMEVYRMIDRGLDLLAGGAPTDG